MLTALITAAAAAVSLAVAPAAYGQRLVDQGNLVVLRGGQVVGTEDFQLRRTTVGGDGFTLNATAHYPAEQPTLVITATVHLRADSGVASARFEAQNGGRHFVLVDVGARRVTVRIGIPGREATREFPSGQRYILANDSLFALYALLPGAAQGPVEMLWANEGRRASTVLTAHGQETTTLGREQRRLDRWTLGSGEGARHLWFDQDGRLQKVTVPALDITVLRTAPSR